MARLGVDREDARVERSASCSSALSSLGSSSATVAWPAIMVQRERAVVGASLGLRELGGDAWVDDPRRQVDAREARLVPQRLDHVALGDEAELDQRLAELQAELLAVLQRELELRRVILPLIEEVLPTGSADMARVWLRPLPWRPIGARRARAGLQGASTAAVARSGSGAGRRVRASARQVPRLGAAPTRAPRAFALEVAPPREARRQAGHLVARRGIVVRVAVALAVARLLISVGRRRCAGAAAPARPACARRPRAALAVGARRARSTSARAPGRRPPARARARPRASPGARRPRPRRARRAARAGSARPTSSTAMRTSRRAR